MKKLLAIILMMLTLTGCSFVMMSKNKPHDPEDMLKPDPELTAESAEEEIVVVPVEEPEAELVEEEMPYESFMVDGVVEDTIGFGFEIPEFDCPGSEKIGEFFEWFVMNMEEYTKDVVYENAMSRSCIASVYGTVDSATATGDLLQVTYSYACQYSDSEEPEVETTVMCFDMITGDLVE